MNTWYLVSFPAWLILAVTAAARLSDIGPHQWAMHDHFRRLGIIGVGVTSLCTICVPLASDWWRFHTAGWQDAAMAWSWALVWITTPGTPPWWDFILGVHRRTDVWRELGLWARIRGEARALRDSFRPRRRRPDYQSPEQRDTAKP